MSKAAIGFRCQEGCRGVGEGLKKRISNIEPQNFERLLCYAQPYFIKQKEDIPSAFEIHYSIFDIRFLFFYEIPGTNVFFAIRLAAEN